MKKEKTRLIIGAISIILIVIGTISLFASSRFFDSLEGDYGGSRQMSAIALVLALLLMLGGAITNIRTRKIISRKQFFVIGLLYSIGVILSFVPFGGPLLAICMLFSVFCAINYIVLAIKEKPQAKRAAYLTSCPLCNHDVSSEARVCPNCSNRLTGGK